jgi:AcrR family transcriptional regulator
MAVPVKTDPITDTHDLLKTLIPGSAKDPDLVEKRQDHIVQGALSLFFKKGFNRTSIREIASACGMSMGQLYHYISSKDDVLFLVHKHMHELVVKTMATSGFEAIEDPRDRLAHAVRTILELMTTNKELFQFVYTESKHLDREHLRAILRVDDKHIVGFWRLLISEAKGTAFTEKEVDLAANFVAYALVFLALRGWNLRKTTSSENVDFVTNFVLKGLGINDLG